MLSKPGALFVCPLPGNPSATASDHDVHSAPTAAQPKHASDASQGESIGDVDSAVFTHSGFASHTSAMDSTNTAHPSIKPNSTIDDKLLENLKSLDSPQIIPSKPAEKSTQGDVVVGTNFPESDQQGSSNSELNTSNVSTSNLARSSSQEDVHKLQQKVLLQQQQLIEQQQRFLEQQTLGEHSHVWRLMEQIKQQQKELEELRSEMKVKDQFGEIEKHLENLERRQNQTDVKKPAGLKSDGAVGERNETESKKVSEEMFEKNKESENLKVEKQPLDHTTQYQLSEITSEVKKEPSVSSETEGVKDDFLITQLREFSLSPSQHNDNDVMPASTREPTITPVAEQGDEVRTATLSEYPPPKPSRMSPDKHDLPTLKKSEDLPAVSTSSSSEIDTPVLTQQSEIASNVEAVDPPKEIEGS